MIATPKVDSKYCRLRDFKHFSIKTLEEIIPAGRIFVIIAVVDLGEVINFHSFLDPLDPLGPVGKSNRKRRKRMTSKMKTISSAVR